MKQTIRLFTVLVERLKLTFALLALWLAGALAALTVSTWYYTNAIDKMQESYTQRILAYDRQVTRLQHDIDLSRGVNSMKLDNILDKLEKTSVKLGRTTSTANLAARTAKEAAKNAAQANITVTEYQPAIEPPEPPAFPPRIEP